MPPPDFALKQLQKYGWTPGQGLGLNQDGMAEPLQLGLKLNQKGLGQDELDKKKSGWGNQWWDSIFNKTLKSLDVTTGDSHEEVNPIPLSNHFFHDSEISSLFFVWVVISH